MVQYSFTLRKTTRNSEATEQDYYRYFAKYTASGLLLNLCYFEMTAGLHAHGVMDIPTDFNMKLLRVRGWNIKYDLIYNYTNWVNYCTKDVYNQEMELLNRIANYPGRLLPMVDQVR